MPRFKGSCGCYNREDARTIGLVPAIVWNDMLDRAEHFDINPMWYDQKDAADRLGMSETSLKRAVDKLVEAGRITKRKGYRPGTTMSTTWITIFENVNDDTSRKSDLTLPRKSDLALPIYNDTNEQNSEGVDDDDASINTIPLAAPTTSYVEVETFASDDNDKTIVVKREIPRKYWNNAVKIWRKDESKFARVEFKDEPGKATKLRPSQIKSWNVRPQTQSLGYDRSAGTAFGVSHD